MDKQEYKILTEEIMTLIANEQFLDAAKIADKIDWRKVRSFSMLQRISDLYKSNRRYEEALEIELMAYEKNANSRTIVYSLCELYLELNDLVSALQYLALYKKMAPNDASVYILQYKVLELEDTTLEDRIELLEEFCRKDYREEWAYQLAYLYHRIGFATKCIETCDQLITWFGDGPFVIKAMELKMLHTRLTPKQQEIYDRRNAIAEQIEAYESDEYTSEKPEPGAMPELGDEDFHVKTIDMSKFNTINLQKALAESMRELMGEEEDKDERITRELMAPMMDEDPLLDTDAILNKDSDENFESEELADNYGDYNYSDDYNNGDYNDEEYSDGEYSEGEYADEEYSDEQYTDEEYSSEEYVDEEYTEEYVDEQNAEGYVDSSYDNQADQIISDIVNDIPENTPEGVPDETAFIGNTPYASRYAANDSSQNEQINENTQENESKEDEVFFDDKTGDIVIDTPPAGMVNDGSLFNDIESISEDDAMALAAATISAAVGGTGKIKLTGDTGRLKIDDDGNLRTGSKAVFNTAKLSVGAGIAGAGAAVKAAGAGASVAAVAPKPAVPSSTGRIRTGNTGRLDSILSLEHDGQISLAIKDEPVPEKQITGQLNIDEVLDEWENIKQAAELQQQKDIKNSIMEKTGQIFAHYDNSKSGILAEIEEDERQRKKVLKNDIEIKKADDLKTVDKANTDKKPFDATAALNQTFKNTIWDEIEAAEGVAAATEGAASVAAGVAEGAAGVAAGVAGGVVAAAAGTVASLADDAFEGATSDEGVTFGDTTIIASDIKTESAAEAAMSLANEASDEYVEAEVEEAEDTEIADTTGDELSEEEYSEEEYTDEEYYEDDEYEEEYADEEYYEEGEYSDEEYYEEGEYADEEAYDDTLNTAEINNIGEALEADADKARIETVNEKNDDYSVDDERELSEDEKELFADFLYSRKMRGQILDAVDIISLAPYVGNVIITGDSNTEITELAKAMIKEVQLIDNNFVSSKVAKISGSKLNIKDIPPMLAKLANGALIVENAGEITKDTLENLTLALENNKDGIIIVLADDKKSMDALIDKYNIISGYFNARVDITPMNENALIEYAKKYAYQKEYKIDDERGVLALSERIGELQIGDHNVTTKEIEDIVEDAIWHSQKSRLSGFVNILLNKRYDDEDMIILREKDFE